MVEKIVVTPDEQIAPDRSKWEVCKITLLSVGSLVMAVLLLFYLSYLHQQEDMKSLMLDINRDFTRVPFNMLDATEFCRRKTERRYGAQLALSYVDEHSSRIDSRSGIYKIFMFAHVGNLRDYEEEAVHCFVDPERRVLTHYRTISSKKTSLVSRAAKFFQSI